MPALIREFTVNLDALRTCKVCAKTKPCRDFYITKYTVMGKPVFRRTCDLCYRGVAAQQRERRRDYYREQAGINNAKKRWIITGLPPDRKKCQRCQIIKDAVEFDRSQYHNRLRNVCKCCHADPSSRRERIRENNRNWLARFRRKVINGLGGKCVCCDESTYEFLAIDHIGGWGRLHRQARKRKQQKVLKDIVEQGFPKDKYRILCHNCHLAVSFYGKCPHENGVTC